LGKRKEPENNRPVLSVFASIKDILLFSRLFAGCLLHSLAFVDLLPVFPILSLYLTLFFSLSLTLCLAVIPPVQLPQFFIVSLTKRRALYADCSLSQTFCFWLLGTPRQVTRIALYIRVRVRVSVLSLSPSQSLCFPAHAHRQTDWQTRRQTDRQSMCLVAGCWLLWL